MDFKGPFQLKISLFQKSSIEAIVDLHGNMEVIEIFNI